MPTPTLAANRTLTFIFDFALALALALLLALALTLTRTTPSPYPYDPKPRSNQLDVSTSSRRLARCPFQVLDAGNTKAISLAEFGRFFRELPLRAQAANLAAVAAAGAPVVTRLATSFAPRAARRASASNLNEGLVSPVRSACLSKRPA